MEVNFKALDVYYFGILEMNGKRYVLDSNSLTSKCYYWGFAPKEFKLDIIELEDSNRNFDKKIKMAPEGSHSLAVSLGIGLSLVLNRIWAGIFRYYSISQNLYFKILLFLLSILIAFVIYRFILWRSRKEIARRLTPNRPKYKIVFRNVKKQRQFHAYVFLVPIFIVFGIYMKIHNGTEACLLFVNGMLAYLDIWIESGSIPLEYAYRKGRIEFERLEAVDEDKSIYKEN